MGGRGRLVSGFRPWLADHRGPDGWEFNRYIRAAIEIVGTPNGSESLRVEIERYAKTGVAFEIASRAWAEAVAKRETGKGRRPSARTVERCARRMGLADMSLRDATTRLRELAARPGRDLSSIVQQAHEDGPAR